MEQTMNLIAADARDEDDAPGFRAMGDVARRLVDLAALRRAAEARRDAIPAYAWAAE